MVRALIVRRPDDPDASRLADAVAAGLRDGGVFTHLCAACTAPDGPAETWEVLIEAFRAHPAPGPSDRRMRFRATLRRSPHIIAPTPSPPAAEPTMELELSDTDLDGAREWGRELAVLVRAEVASRDIDGFSNVIAGGVDAAGR